MGAGSLAPSDRRPDAAPPGSLEDLEVLEDRIGHRFRSRALLEQALTHPSRANELGDLARSNERLEFLGDAVIELLVSEILMHGYPEAHEGVLTRARADAVNKRALAERARNLGLDTWVRLNKGEEQEGGRNKDSILANTFEALLGAVYLDGGHDAAQGVVARELGPRLHAAELDARDPKSRLNEILTGRGEPTARYEVMAERGPSHQREFDVVVRVSGRELGRGTGSSKREAEQAAAESALAGLEA